MDEEECHENVQTRLLHQGDNASASFVTLYIPRYGVLIKVGAVRKAMRSHTFANGITIPKGKLVCAPLTSIHRDDDIYEAANEFDGFRFSRMREKKGENAKHHASNTNVDFLPFGHGRHAW